MADRRLARDVGLRQRRESRRARCARRRCLKSSSGPWAWPATRFTLKTRRSSAGPARILSCRLRNFVINGIQTSHGNFIGGPILGSGMFMPEFTSALSDPETSQGGHPNVHYTVGAAAVTLEIDKQDRQDARAQSHAGRRCRQGDQPEPGERPDRRRDRAGVGDGAVRRHPLRPEGQTGERQFHGLQDPDLDGCAGRDCSDHRGSGAAGWSVRGARGRANTR